MKMGKLKLTGVFSLFLIAIMAISTCVSAISIDTTNMKVEINGNPVTESITAHIEDIDRGEDLEIKARFKATANASNVELHAAIFGYEYNDRTMLSDVSSVFDVKEGVTYTETLHLSLPDRLDRNIWKLRLFFADRAGELVSKDYTLDVGTDRHQVKLKDITFSPETSVQAGEHLIAIARVKNTGEQPEEGIKIRISIPDLVVSTTDYIDVLESEETTTSEGLYMVIPECSPAGTYKAIIELSYADGEEITRSEKNIVVTEDSACEAKQKAEEKTILTVGPESQTVKAGEKIVYPITISNAGTTARQYTVSAETGDWAELSISPSNVVVLESGEAKAVYVYATAKSDAEGEQLIAAKISSGDKVLKDITLKANVVGAAGWESVKKGLEVGLVILVILLVIIGLIIGFNRLKGNEDEEKDDAQTYY